MSMSSESIKSISEQQISIFEEDDLDIPSEIRDQTKEMMNFIHENYLTEPLRYEVALKHYFSPSEKICNMMCQIFQTMCKLLNLPSTIFDDFEYSLNTVIDSILQTKTVLRSSILSNATYEIRENQMPKSIFSQSYSPRSPKLDFNEIEHDNDNELNVIPKGEFSPIQTPISSRSQNISRMSSFQSPMSESQVKTLENEILNLKQQLFEAQSENQQSDIRITDLTNEQTKLRTTSQNEIFVLKKEISNQVHTIETLKDEIIILKSKIQSIEDRAANFQRQNKELSALNDELAKKVQQVHDNYNKKSQKVRDLKATIGKLNLALKNGATVDNFLNDSLSDQNEFNDENNSSMVSPYTDKDKLKMMKMEDTIELLTQSNIQLELDNKKKDAIVANTFSIMQKQLSLMSEYEYRISLKDEEIDSIKQEQKQSEFQSQKDIDNLKEKINEMKIELQKLTDQLRKEKESQPKIVPKEIPVNNNSNEINRLRGFVDILTNFIENILTKENFEAVPLLQTATPILKDDSLRDTLLQQIDSIKFSFSEYKKSRETEFFNQIFTNPENLVDHYIQSGRNDLYAPIIALSAANSRLLSILHYQRVHLDTLNEFIPSGYEKLDDPIMSFCHDSRRVYNLLMQVLEAIHGEAEIQRQIEEHSHESKGSLVILIDFIKELKVMVANVEELIRGPFNFHDKFTDLPLFFRDYAINVKNKMEEAKEFIFEQDQKIGELQTQTREISFEENESNSRTINEMEQVIEDCQKKIDSLTSEADHFKEQAETAKLDKDEIQKNFETIQFANSQLQTQIVHLKNEIKGLEKRLKSKEAMYKQRFNESLKSIHDQCDLEISLIKKKHRDEITILQSDLDKKTLKNNGLKAHIDDLEQSINQTIINQRQQINELKEYIEKSDGKIQQLETKISALNKINSSTSPMKSIESPPPLYNSFSAIDEKNDRFALQVGRILQKYFRSNDKVWTRTKVISSINVLIDTITQLEKQSIPNEQNNLELVYRNQKQNSEMIRQSNLSQVWAKELVESIGLPIESSENNRAIIKDFVMSSLSKSKLVFKLQLLRNEKKMILKNERIYLQVSTKGNKLRSGQNEPKVMKLKPLIVVVSMYLRLKKYASSAPNSGSSTPIKPKPTRLALTPK